MLPSAPSLRRTARTGLPGVVHRRAKPGSPGRGHRRDISRPAGPGAPAWRVGPVALLGYGPCLTTLRRPTPQFFVHAQQNAAGCLHAEVKKSPARPACSICLHSSVSLRFFRAGLAAALDRVRQPDEAGALRTSALRALEKCSRPSSTAPPPSTP